MLNQNPSRRSLHKSHLLLLSLVLIMTHQLGFAHSADLSVIRIKLDEPSKIEIYAHSDYFGDNYADVLANNLKLSINNQTLTLNTQEVELDAKNNTLFWETELENLPKTLKLEHKLFPEIDSSYTIVSVSKDRQLLDQSTLRLAADSFSYTTPRSPVVLWLSSTWAFVWQGMKHIFTGFDHVLFLLGLLLLGGSIRQLIKVISAFTVAHAFTFFLAATGTMTLPAGFVEPIIALSIVMAAFANLRPQASTQDIRPVIAFTFGLIHGFGFAGLLGGLGFEGENLLGAFIAFALGLELGQLMIAAGIIPLLLFIARKKHTLSLRINIVGSLAISLVGSIWFLERLL